MGTPVQAVIFDLDNTLYPEAEYVSSGFEAVAQHVEARGLCPAPTFREQCLRVSEEPAFRGRVFNEALARLGCEVNPPLIASLVQVYRGHPPRIALCRDARAALADLSRSLVLGILTDGDRRAQLQKVAVLGVRAWVRAVAVNQSPRFWKPHPRGFRRLLRRLGVAPNRAVMVGDQPKDMIGAQNLGLRAVRIVRPGVAAGPCTPDFTIHALTDLPGCLA